MCKLSWNIVPNVYYSLQSSFLSLAWPWPGRSLPKGNQWEWWDPQQGPLPGLGEVGYSPRGTSGSAGTLDWGPMWSGSQSTCQPQCPLHPLEAPNAPLCHLYPSYPWVGTLPAIPQYSPYTPLTAPQCSNTPWHLHPKSPQCPFTLLSPE